MNINKKITPYNFSDKNDVGRIKYIVIHYFGSLATAANLASYWAGKYVGTSAHYAVGHDGSVYQCVEDCDIAWHCGASSYKHSECRNSNSIGIEMAVRKKSTATMGAADKDWYFEDKTVTATVELVKELIKKYNIPIKNVIRHYDVTGKTCPNPYVTNLFEYTWESFKQVLGTENSAPSKTPPVGQPKQETDGLTLITGNTMATAEQMAAYLISKNPNTKKYAFTHAEQYIREGSKEGIRADIAFAQRCIETGNDTFKGSSVTSDQYNYGGFGVTKKGMKGESFVSAEIGIRVHIQHLKAYANEAGLVNECVDPRFKYVKRGCAAYVEHLGIQENPNKVGWAAGAEYGKKILLVLAQILKAELEKESEQKKVYYRIRRRWDSPNSQLYALTNLEKAIDACPTGYKVFEENGAVLYDPDAVKNELPYEITISNCTSLSIRPLPNMNKAPVGVICENKRYTIVEEKDGWGKLKSGTGWIKLSFTKKV